ncbi:MAG: SRPBCC family protein [Arachnia sp.]
MTDQSETRYDSPGGAPAGSVHEGDGCTFLRFVRHYRTAIDDVWSALTVHDRMGRWAFPGHLEPRVGGRVRFDTDTADTPLGRILQWDAPRLLEYHWGSGEDAWHVRFELATTGDAGTTLTFDHLLPEPTNPEFAAGWHWHLDRLQQLLAGDEPDDVDEDQHFHDLMEHYAN